MTKKDGLNFKLENNLVEISTAQRIDFDEFVRRIAGIEAQKTNFEMQIGYMKTQIDDANKNIELANKNIEYATEDLEKAYSFLRLNHREDLIKRIEAKVEENKKTAAAQVPAQQ